MIGGGKGILPERKKRRGEVLVEGGQKRMIRLGVF